MAPELDVRVSEHHPPLAGATEQPLVILAWLRHERLEIGDGRRVAVAGPVEDDLLLERAQLRHRVGPQSFAAVGDRALKQLVGIRLLGKGRPPVDVATDPGRVRNLAQNIDRFRRQRPEQRVVAAQHELVGAGVAGVLEHRLQREDVAVYVV